MKIIPLLLAPVLLAGCGLATAHQEATHTVTVSAAAPQVNPTTNRPSADEDFLMLLRSQGFFYAGDDRDLTGLGQSICRALDQGNSVNDVMALGLGSGLSQNDVATLIAAAILAYCPWNDPR